MDINKKYIIIFGTLILLLIIVIGGITYYNKRKEQVQISDIPDWEQDALSFSQNYPISFEETDLFHKDCAGSIIIGMSTLMDQNLTERQEIREIFCTLEQYEKYTGYAGKYINVLRLLKQVPNFKQGQYISIAVKYKDLLQKNTSVISLEDGFNLCAITKPALREPFREQLLLENQINLNRDIVFSDGEIFCSRFFGFPSERLNLLISGFVPQEDLFRAKIYLVPEDIVVNQLLPQESLVDIEKILQSYSLLWEIEKPII